MCLTPTGCRCASSARIARVPDDLRDQFLKRALNEILGSDGWRSGTRHGSQWILATDPGTRT